MPTFEEIKAECLKENKLFKDPDFPAEKSILHDDYIQTVEWKRPHDFPRATQPVFLRKATYYDINQGHVGDCFFLGAVNSLMANDMEAFNKVMPRDQSFQKDYAGIFRFNFWQYGDWKEVYVDDRLPTINGELIYCKNRNEPDEFWVCLLEKAYAKLHGSYKNIHGGFETESLVDMTGGVSQRISLKSANINAEELFNTIDKMWKMDTLMTTSFHDEDNTSPDNLSEADKREDGLFGSHAYALTSLATVPFHGKPKRLIRLRNPHGCCEWTSKWSDKSTEWEAFTEDEKKKYGVTISEEGEFWMSLDDFIRVFDAIGLCHMDKSAFRNIVSDPNFQTTKAKWTPYIFKDRWVKSISSGGFDQSKDSFWTNPQYIMDLSKRTENTWVVISLMDKVPRNMGKPGLLIGFNIYKVKAEFPIPPSGRVYPDALTFHSNGIMTKRRETSESLELPPGKYVLIVYNKEKSSNDYLLRIYSECNITVRAVDDAVFPSPLNEVDVAEDHLQVAFEKYCEKTERNVDAAALRSVVLYALRKDTGIDIDLSLESMRSLMTYVHRHHYGLIDLNCARKIYATLTNWLQRFLVFDKNRSMSIEVAELINLLESFDLKVGRKVAESLVNRYAGRNGVIDFDDLIQCICRAFSLHRSYTIIRWTDNIISISVFISETIRA